MNFDLQIENISSSFLLRVIHKLINVILILLRLLLIKSAEANDNKQNDGGRCIQRTHQNSTFFIPLKMKTIRTKITHTSLRQKLEIFFHDTSSFLFSF